MEAEKIKGDKVQYYMGLAYLENLDPEKALAAFKAGKCNIPKNEFANCGDKCLWQNLFERAKRAYEIAGIDEKERYIQLANELLDKGSILKSLKFFEISKTDPPEEKLRSCLQKLIEKGYYFDEIREIYGFVKGKLDETEKKKLRDLCMEYLRSQRTTHQDTLKMILKDIGDREAMLEYANELVSRNSTKKAKKIFEIIVLMDNK